MKPTLVVLIAAFLASFNACKTDFSDHQEEIHKMEDSLFANFPTVNRVTIKVSSDFSKELLVTLGDKELYNASEEERNKVIRQTERITKNIFKDRAPQKGEVIFVEEENTINGAPGMEKKYPLVLKDAE